ncbi:MAG: mycofactocin precursor MftA [Actinomycetota bacterium]
MLEQTAQTSAATEALPDCAATSTNANPPLEGSALVEADLLVEDVSIDGMCGVY